MTPERDAPHVRMRARFGSGQRAGIAAAEAWEAGASGIEELGPGADGAPDDPASLVIYCPATAAAAVAGSVRAVLTAADVLEAPEALEPVDWSSAWREGLEPIEVSERLLVRPTFAAAEARPGRIELVVEPRQAFGTGGHASTRGILEWLCDCEAELAGARVLDVGTGTGVLALAALALGAERAVGCDIDPVAAREARHWARENGLDADVAFFAGSLDAMGPAAFDWVLANMLRRELLPLADGIAERVAAGGHAVFAGLLAAELEEVEDAFAKRGLHRRGLREGRDANGDRWVALCTRRE